MLFDSEQQKNFILDAVRKYPTNYETALNLANAFGVSIQEGRIIAVKEQLAKFPIDIAVDPKAPPTRNEPDGGPPDLDDQRNNGDREPDKEPKAEAKK